MRKLTDVKAKLNDLFNNERGDFGIKEIAMAVASVAIIGIIFTFISKQMPTWLGDIWEKISSMLDEFTSGA